MKVLVTGATGFIGSHVARILVEAGLEVRVLARRGHSTLTIADRELETVWGDIRDLESVREAVRGCQGIFHVAAAYAFWARDPRLFYATNVEGARNVFQAALEVGVRRVVHTSTAATVGSPPRGELATEATEPKAGELRGSYRCTKYLAEQEARAFAGRGLDVVVVNPTTVVGWGDARPTPTGRLIVDFLRGRIPAYVKTWLNLVDVENVARGHWLAWSRGKMGERYLLGGHNMTLRQLLETLAQITGRPAPRLRVPLWLALGGAYVDNFIEGRLLRQEPRIPLEGVLHARAYRAVDCSKARVELGFSASPAEEALEKAVRWYVGHGYV